MDKIFDLGDKLGILGIIIGTLAYVGMLWAQQYFNKKTVKNVQSSQKDLTDTLVSNLNEISKQQHEQNQYLMDNLVAQNKELLTKIINSAYKDREDQHLRSQDYRLKISPTINGIIENICIGCHAARVVILEFCNGAKNSIGISFMHYKISYQYHQKGIIPYDMDSKLNINEVINVVDRINKSEHNAEILDKEFFDSETERIGKTMFNTNSSQMTKLAVAGLYDNGEQQKIRGILAIEFDKKFDFNEDIFDRELIKTEIGKIETYLFNEIYSEDYIKDHF